MAIFLPVNMDAATIVACPSCQAEYYFITLGILMKINCLADLRVILNSDLIILTSCFTASWLLKSQGR